MSNDKKKIKLETLRKEESLLLKKHEENSSSSLVKGDDYMKENLIALKKINKLRVKIREFEWQLKTPKEQQELLEHYEKIQEEQEQQKE